jgi:choline-sulfatase
MIRELNNDVRLILDALEASGQADDTIVVLWADHGEFAGDHQMATKYDTTLYDSLLHVPLIMRGPGVPEGQVRNTMVESVDILPTVADLCGVDIPRDIHGRSLRPCMENAGVEHRSSVLAQGGYDARTLAHGVWPGDAEGPYYAKNKTAHEFPESMCRTAMVRTQDWKLIHRQEGPNELYDLQDDPHELCNLYGMSDLREVQQRMQELLLDRCVEAWQPVSPEGDHEPF